MNHCSLFVVRPRNNEIHCMVFYISMSTTRGNGIQNALLYDREDDCTSSLYHNLIGSMKLWLFMVRPWNKGAQCLFHYRHHLCYIDISLINFLAISFSYLTNVSHDWPLSACSFTITNILPSAEPQQPLAVAMGNNRFTVLVIDKVNSMFRCGDVTPSTLNAIHFVDVICPVMGNKYERFRYVYVYQELQSYFHLFELEVTSKWHYNIHGRPLIMIMLRYSSSLEETSPNTQCIMYGLRLPFHIYPKAVGE